MPARAKQQTCRSVGVRRVLDSSIFSLASTGVPFGEVSMRCSWPTTECEAGRLTSGYATKSSAQASDRGFVIVVEAGDCSAGLRLKSHTCSAGGVWVDSETVGYRG